jgi:tetratricopeptide (TPR) repeat protein
MTRNTKICGTTLCGIMAALMGGGLLLAPVVGMAQQTASQQGNPEDAVFPLTTKSPEARRLAEESLWLSVDRAERKESAEILRKALQIDPEFAMAHEFSALISQNSADQLSEQEKASATRNHASPPEQMAIEWLQDAADNKLMSAIPKMNVLLRQYPHDKRVVWMAVLWLRRQTQYERAIAVYEGSGITDSPGLMNNTAYNYAHIRQFNKAFAMMDQYVAALPNDANPQDSYAEILRMAGLFDRAIEHYRAALAINPQFYASQFGIADTYALMGDQVRARREYAIGFQKFSALELQEIRWRTREATTFIREGDYEGAGRAFQAIADYARSRQNGRAESDTYRQMAIYQQNPKQALIFLDKAEAVTRKAGNPLKIAMVQELAQILRARVEVDLKMGKKKMADSDVARLAKMSESSGDKQIEVEYHGANGAVLFSQHKYDEAISHLEEDPDNPFSLRLLVVAYQKIGYSAGAKWASEILANLNDPTLEQALVVPAFRKCYDTPACSDHAKAAPLHR